MLEALNIVNSLFGMPRGCELNSSTPKSNVSAARWGASPRLALLGGFNACIAGSEHDQFNLRSFRCSRSLPAQLPPPGMPLRLAASLVLALIVCGCRADQVGQGIRPPAARGWEAPAQPQASKRVGPSAPPTPLRSASWFNSLSREPKGTRESAKRAANPLPGALASHRPGACERRQQRRCLPTTSHSLVPAASAAFLV